MKETKSFSISKWVVWEAYKRVKANKGSSGVDGQSINDFEKKVKDNLYKIWNRMSSGSYFPPPVKRVEISKGGGKKRALGIPTVADRIAQMVVKSYLEPEVEPEFHRDSYGYRPGKSAHDAIAKTRERCWQYSWVIDMDIEGFFDNIDHELMMELVRKHTDNKWILMYVERWLKAPVEMPDGTIEERTMGTPQGGVISPLLANIFLHYAFNKWMEKEFHFAPFERYADDIIVHCRTKGVACRIKGAVARRLRKYKLRLNYMKTKIVYCGSGNRKVKHPDKKFDFLGYTYMWRKLGRGWGAKAMMTYSPAVSRKALKSIGDTIRSWQLHRRSDLTLEEIAKWVNPKVRGWINYYGKYRKSALFPMFMILFSRKVKWVQKKYKIRNYTRAYKWLIRLARRERHLFSYWNLWYRTGGGITRAV